MQTENITPAQSPVHLVPKTTEAVSGSKPKQRQTKFSTKPKSAQKAETLIAQKSVVFHTSHINFA